jgi:hypothetical protein
MRRARRQRGLLQEERLVISKAYIDVRGHYPVLVSGPWAYSLEHMILEKAIPQYEWRDICVSEAMEYVTEIEFTKRKEAE